jgi:hypothetical protein
MFAVGSAERVIFDDSQVDRLSIYGKYVGVPSELALNPAGASVAGCRSLGFAGTSPDTCGTPVVFSSCCSVA